MTGHLGMDNLSQSLSVKKTDFSLISCALPVACQLVLVGVGSGEPFPAWPVLECQLVWGAAGFVWAAITVEGSQVQIFSMSRGQQSSLSSALIIFQPIFLAVSQALGQGLYYRCSMYDGNSTLWVLYTSPVVLCCSLLLLHTFLW